MGMGQGEQCPKRASWIWSRRRSHPQDKGDMTGRGMEGRKRRREGGGKYENQRATSNLPERSTRRRFSVSISGCFNAVASASVEESENLTTSALPASLFVVHNAKRSGHHDVSELTRRKQVVGPLLDGTQFQIESW
uniref:Uncharacterized protein n=1 Tax=Cryptomonas curvata TaxID=233186 RepID=A0A7S0N0S7_9CRYP